MPPPRHLSLHLAKEEDGPTPHPPPPLNFWPLLRLVSLLVQPDLVTRGSSGTRLTGVSPSPASPAVGAGYSHHLSPVCPSQCGILMGAQGAEVEGRVSQARQRRQSKAF